MARVLSVCLVAVVLLNAALTFVTLGSSRPSPPALRGQSAPDVQSTAAPGDVAWPAQAFAAVAAFGLIFGLASVPQAAMAQPNPNGIFSKMAAQPEAKNEVLVSELKAERDMMKAQTETKAQRDERNMRALDEERKIVKLDEEA